MRLRTLAALFAVTTCWTFTPAVAATVELAPTRANGLVVVVVSGEIDIEDGRTFGRVVRTIPDGGAIVLLDGPGGNLMGGLAIGEKAREKGFATAVAPGTRCASACAYAWIGGAKRFMDPASRIGFHAAYAKDGAPGSGMGNAIVGAYLNRMGVSLMGVAYATSAGPDEMRWLTMADAERIGLSVVVPRSALARRPSDVGPERGVAPSQKDAGAIGRAVASFEKRYIEEGMSGAKESVETCYTSMRRKPSRDLGAYCFALDYVAMRVDQSSPARRMPPMSRFFEPASVVARLRRALEKLDFDASDRSVLVRGWTDMTERSVAEMSARVASRLDD